MLAPRIIVSMALAGASKAVKDNCVVISFWQFSVNAVDFIHAATFY
jgi:hypothetical protein